MSPANQVMAELYELLPLSACIFCAITPVGAFKLDIGPETPTYYLLIPTTSAELLGTLDTRLAGDTEFLKTSTAFWGAPASHRRLRAWKAR
jgi:hypothetical protein